MRQFVTLRFWMTLLALAGMAFAAVLVLRAEGDAAVTSEVLPDEPPTRRIDLLQWVFSVVPADGFAIDDGVTTADLALVIDGSRTMVVKAGTPGEVDCPGLDEVAKCTVAAHLMGDAVLWFSIIPGAAAATVQLPAVTEILDNGWLRLANGWLVRHAEKVDRRCDEETTSLTDFIRTYGDRATTTYSYETQEVVRVTCP